MSAKKPPGTSSKPARPTTKPKKPKASPRAKATKPAPTEEELLQLEEQKPLTEVEELFAHEYLLDLNATQAYLRVHPNVKATSARVQGCRTLARPNVAARVAQLTAERMKRLEIDTDRLLRHADAIATTDHRELSEYYRTCCRYCYGEGYRYQRTEGEMERDREAHQKAEDEREEKAAILNKVFVAREFDEKGGAGYDGKRDPNTDCPECFGWGIGRSIMKDTRKLSDAGVILFAGVEETKDGLKIKAHDKLKAKDMLFRHKGLYEADNVQQARVKEKSPEEWAALYAEATQEAMAQRDAMLERRQAIEAMDEQERFGTAGGAGAGGAPAGGAPA